MNGKQARKNRKLVQGELSEFPIYSSISIGKKSMKLTTFLTTECKRFYYKLNKKMYKLVKGMK